MERLQFSTDCASAGVLTWADPADNHIGLSRIVRKNFALCANPTLERNFL